MTLFGSLHQLNVRNCTEIMFNVHFIAFFLIATSDLKRFQFNYEEEVQEEDKLHGKAKFLEVTFLIWRTRIFYKYIIFDYVK